MISTILIMFVVTGEARQHSLHHHKSFHYFHLKNMLKSSENIFIEAQKHVQTIMNKLFKSMKLTEQFPDRPRIKLLLTMHFDLNNIAERNFAVYEVLRNATAVKFDNKAVSAIKLDDLVSEILAGINSYAYNKMKEPSSSNSKSNITETRRLFEGGKSNISRFPFVASIHIINKFTCTGNIISVDLVLTAASCLQMFHNSTLFMENPMSVFIRIGSDWTSDEGEIIPVIEIYFNPSYDPKLLKNNIAILRIERGVDMKEREETKVEIIELDVIGALPLNTEDVIILAWGAKMGSQDVMFEKLNVASLEMFPVEECQSIYSMDYVTEDNFCAGFLTKRCGACKGDVGSPGVVADKLVGIVSFRAPVCSTRNTPLVFTRVRPYIDWIESVMKADTIPYSVHSDSVQSVITSSTSAFFETDTILKPEVTTSKPEVNIVPDSEEAKLKKILIVIEQGNDSVLHDMLKEEEYKANFSEVGPVFKSHTLGIPVSTMSIEKDIVALYKDNTTVDDDDNDHNVEIF